MSKDRDKNNSKKRKKDTDQRRRNQQSKSSVSPNSNQESCSSHNNSVEKSLKIQAQNKQDSVQRIHAEIQFKSEHDDQDYAQDNFSQVVDQELDSPLPIRGRGRSGLRRRRGRRNNRGQKQSKQKGASMNSNNRVPPQEVNPDDDVEEKAVEILSEVQKELRQQGDTVIHEIVLNNNPQQLQSFIRSGCRIFNQSSYDGATALHRAAEINSLECARILIEQNADIDAVDFRGQSAFHVAAEYENFDIARFLVRNGAKYNCRPNCVKCKKMKLKIKDFNNQSRKLADRIRREKLKEEQKQKEEEERQQVSSQNQLFEELQKLREELGGPFFSKEENIIYRREKKKAREEYKTFERQRERRLKKQQRDCNTSSIQDHINQIYSNILDVEPELVEDDIDNSITNQQPQIQDESQVIKPRNRRKNNQNQNQQVEKRSKNKSRSPNRKPILPSEEDIEYPIQLRIHDERNEEHKISEMPRSGMGPESFVIDELEESKGEFLTSSVSPESRDRKLVERDSPNEVIKPRNRRRPPNNDQ